MSIKAIAQINPDLNVEKLQIGQKINLSVSEPYLNVEATVKLAVDQNIPYDTKYVTDNNLSEGRPRLLPVDNTVLTG
jgi:hypothetical protein